MFKHVWRGWTLPVEQPLSHGVFFLTETMFGPDHAQIFTNNLPWVIQVFQIQVSD